MRTTVVKEKNKALQKKSEAKAEKYDKDFQRFARMVTNKYFGLILLPTEKCNFRCTYCYEDYKIGKMSRATVEAVKQLISKRAALNELEYLSIGWFGGEPLLAKDIVFEINEHAQKVSEEGKKFKFSCGMTTNGFLLDEATFDKLVKLNCRQYQISLDGPRDTHNLTRVRANGKGSFDEIWANLLSMKKSTEQFNITLRLHITPTNIEAMKQLLHQIKDSFAGDKRFNVFIRPISNLGGEKMENEKVLDWEKDKNIVDELYAIVGQGDLNAHHIEDEQSGPYVCYAAQPNSLVIRADGTLAKCTVAFKDNVNSIGKINPDGTLAIDNEKINVWSQWLKNMNYDMLKCPYSSICRCKNAANAGELVDKAKVTASSVASN
jgi:uncharacterized protein